MSGDPRWGRRRVVRGAVVAAVLALTLSVSPPATRTAAAAGALRVDGAATYTLDPEGGAFTSRSTSTSPT